jgi:hypothetical protein
MINLIVSSISNAYLMRFLSAQNSAFVGYEQDLSELIQGYEKFQNLVKIGEIEYKNTDKLLVFTCKYLGELTSRSSRKNQYEIAKKALKEDFKDGAVFVFYDDAGRFRFSFIRRNFGDKTNKFTPWKRYTYFVEPDAKTNRTFIERIGSCRFESLDAIQEAFSVEKLTKDFYKELSDWYFWAIKNVSFPNNINDDTDDEKYNSENIIRLITRLIFVWFLKQKNLVKPELFQVEALTSILKNFEPESGSQSQYYRAILQNLFFATLNQEIGHRRFAEDKGFLENRKTYSIKSLYRYENEFKKGAAQALELFSEIPFLNGGLFECLDNKQRDGKVFDWDGFSRNPKHQAKIPNSLFFAKEMLVDLSGEYNDKKMRSVKVSGIIEILSRYNFTIEENTPVEIEVALDPELLGKVFENLLGAFNPETQETARKQTGSFYTPREIVHYMVDESLVSYFKTKVPEVDEETLRLLLSYDEQEVTLSEQLKEKLIQATFDCKILDPACGSGAFPMGALQQMVHLLNKLDPENTYWNNVVMAQAMSDFEKANKLSDEDLDVLKDAIENTFDNGLNYPDYARKLHLIENCIYGVDIQTIAVQISKLRFFISLVCEQRKNEDALQNFGIRPLPNLETKFVAANTLIGIEKTEEDMALFNEDRIKQLIDKLQHIRHRQFLVTNVKEKKGLREKDQQIREEIENEISTLYVKHADELLDTYKENLSKATIELGLLNKIPDNIKTNTSTDLFGQQSTTTHNLTETKRKELKARIKRLEEKISGGSDYSRLSTVVALAKQLTSWNPYDQNQSSPFFDPEWMFGLPQIDGGYFDVVIGNPPYIDIKGLPNEDVKKYFRLFSTTENRINIYSIFIEKGITLLCKSGVLVFINPNSILVNSSYHKIRSFIIDGVEKIIKLPDTIFESATVETIILVSKKKSVSEFVSGLFFSNNAKISFSNLEFNQFNRETWKNDNDNRFNIFGNPYINSIIEKISNQGKYLENFVDVSLGITPYDKYQGQSEEDIKNRVYHSSAKISEDYVPLISGKNINPYVITGDIDEYLKYGEWLGAPRDRKFFESEKIIVRQITSGRELNIIAAFSKEPHYFTQIGFSLVSKNSNSNELKYILSLLNSRLMSFYHKQKYLDIEKFTFQKILIANCKKFPIKIPKNIDLFVKIVDEIINERTISIDSDISKNLNLIESWLYKQYNLTFEEVKVIDPDIESKITEEAYNAIDI